MKKIITAALCTVLIMSVFSACAPGSYKREEGDSDVAFEIMNSLKPEDRQCTEYDFDKYMRPLWEGKIAYHEALLPLENEDGGEIEMPLLYRAEKIISVQSATLRKTYTEGEDYFLRDGKLVLTENTSIDICPYDYYYPAETIANHTFACSKGGNIRLFYPPDMHSRQIVVTYIHDDGYQGPVPERKGENLPKFYEKLEKGEKVTMVWYGDSITVGGDTSSLTNTEPNVPVYPMLVHQSLQKLYPEAEIEYINTSVGGMTLPWAVDNVETEVNAHSPDLVVLAWGMNTAGLNQNNYESRMKILINRIKEKNPDCEFVIVAPMVPNPEATPFNGGQDKYQFAIEKFEGEGIVMANMTTVHEYLISVKRFYDMTGNNINHCNDYLTRWYAQVVLETIKK